MTPAATGCSWCRRVRRSCSIFQINTSTGAINADQSGNSRRSAPAIPRRCMSRRTINMCISAWGPAARMDSHLIAHRARQQQRFIWCRRMAASDNTFAADNNSAYLFVGEAGSGIRVSDDWNGRSAEGSHGFAVYLATWPANPSWWIRPTPTSMLPIARPMSSRDIRWERVAR